MPRGVIQKIDCSGSGLLRCLWLRRDETLLAETEWAWTTERAEAFVFEEFMRADEAAQALRAKGENHVHAFVVSESDPEPFPEPPPRPVSRGAVAQRQRFPRSQRFGRQVSPQEAYAENERRGLA